MQENLFVNRPPENVIACQPAQNKKYFLCKVLTNALGGCTMRSCKGNGVFGL